jgi:DNA-binding transcriptional regulator/RsmH inhibitor MraZ
VTAHFRARGKCLLVLRPDEWERFRADLMQAQALPHSDVEPLRVFYIGTCYELTLNDEGNMKLPALLVGFLDGASKVLRTRPDCTFMPGNPVRTPHL